ncbi:hypothetical protein AAG570_001213 [Ranatra chinensis]|uniref:Uncharacterized protein n=1 Tax=Ranatra chinensis TaxID=642074 RepID=A0ABD0YZC5_9HEMI
MYRDENRKVYDVSRLLFTSKKFRDDCWDFVGQSDAKTPLYFPAKTQFEPSQGLPFEFFVLDVSTFFHRPLKIAATIALRPERIRRRNPGAAIRNRIWNTTINHSDR